MERRKTVTYNTMRFDMPEQRAMYKYNYTIQQTLVLH